MTTQSDSKILLQHELITGALKTNLEEVQAFVDAHLETAGCSRKTRMQIAIAIEEVFVNIANYAYAPGQGDAAIRLVITQEPLQVSITFADHGVRFDPLANEDPDISLPAEEREEGGLGIFMTRKLMDEVQYTYKDGQNQFTMTKKF